MSVRDRTPRPPSSRYITYEGAEKLRAELQQLWSVERPRVTQQVADAAALGDRSENAEYIYGKRRLREIDRRLEFLAKRLDQVEIVQGAPGDARRVAFGAWVEVEDDDGETAEYRIVGADEFDPKQRWISIDSPVARALVGKRLGDEVIVHRPKGEQTLTITAVRYQAKAGGG
ncbi:MAG TPA: transcription elongation factor GreB [Kofleriaceae bacterium]|nr:transcription elongation factor GreB [Kofleriaceae bacterium]